MATHGFSCVSVNQIQATMLDQQADALIQSLVCVYLCECMSHVCGCWQKPKEGADFLELKLHVVVSCLIWVLEYTQVL